MQNKRDGDTILFKDNGSFKNMEYSHSVSTLLNPKSNGGESIGITVDYYKRSDGTIYNDVRFSGTCYSSFNVSFNIFGSGLFGCGLDDLKEAIQKIEKLNEQSE